MKWRKWKNPLPTFWSRGKEFPLNFPHLNRNYRKLIVKTLAKKRKEVTKVLVVIYQFAGPFLLFYLLFILFPFFEPTVCVPVCVCVWELWSVHMCEGVVLSMLVSIICVHVDKQSKLFGRQKKKTHKGRQEEGRWRELGKQKFNFVNLCSFMNFKAPHSIHQMSGSERLRVEN